MQWWCSASALPWSWDWRPYPGVWLFVLVLVGFYMLALRSENARRLSPRGGARRSGGGRTSRPAWRRTAGWAGLVLLWAALDWPIGTLGAGYLSSVHSTQFLLLTFIAPPLLLLGLGPRVPAAGGSRRRGAVLAVLGSALLFNIIVIATHMPRVVDALMPTQLGAFVIDAAWLGGGLLFWRPVLLTSRPFHPLARIGYIFWGTLAHTGIGVYLLLAEFPVYRIFELAPPIRGLDSLSDQQLAGGIMELVGMFIIFGAVSLVALRWMGTENRLEQESRDQITRKEMLPGA